MTSRGNLRVIRKNNAKTRLGIVCLLGILTILGCRSDQKAPDVSHLSGNFQLVRADEILFAMDTLTPQETAENQFKKHQTFWELYFTTIMPPPADDSSGDPDGAQKDPFASSNWRPIVGNPYLRAIAESTRKEYVDMSDINAQFRTGFQYLQYYFPGNRVPNVYTLISGFGYFPFIFEDGDQDGLGISLEMFLGSDFPYRTFVGNAPVFSDYLVRTYNRDHVAKKTFDVLVDDLVGPAPGDKLIDLMIHNGIKLYILEHLLPSLQDTVLFEFTPAQLAWCQANERELWAHLLKDDLIYSDESTRIQKLVSAAPGVPGMPAEAPGGVANWTGWKIIHALTERERDVKLVDLLSIQDSQSVLEAARYRPR